MRCRIHSLPYFHFLTLVLNEFQHHFIRTLSYGSRRDGGNHTHLHYISDDLSATTYVSYNPGLSKEIINYFNLNKRRHSKVCSRHILICLQHQNQYVAQSLVCSKYMSKDSMSERATKSDSCKKWSHMYLDISPDTSNVGVFFWNFYHLHSWGRVKQSVWITNLQRRSKK